MARFKVLLPIAVMLTLLFSLFFVNGSIAQPLGEGLLQHFGVSSSQPGSGSEAAPLHNFGLPVTVMNSNQQPVPVTVQGTTSQPLTATINGTVDTNATINGTVDTQDVNDPSAQPFQFNWPFEISDVSISGSVGVTTFTVPDGKRLIIRYVSGKDVLGPDQAGSIVVFTIADGGSVSHVVPPAISPVTIGTGTFVYFGLETWIAADAGTAVYLYAELDGAAPSVGRTGNVSLSGYLVDMPTTP